MNEAPSTYSVHRAGDSSEARRAYARAITPYLAKREADNNLQLGILDLVAAGRFTATTLLLAEDAHGDTAAVVMHTPPHALLVAAGDVRAAREALLAALLEDGERLPGMVGPLPDVEQAAAWWSAHTGAHARRRMHQGVYRLRAVTPAVRATGRLRPAEERDRYHVIPWLDAFGRETPDTGGTDATHVWDTFQGEGVRRLHLWETPEGRPVSLAAVSGRTPNGVRISSVYTPPQERRRGYASALVAALSQAELDGGARFCFLYTDLANPSTNRVYRDVGYERVGEAAEYAFA